MTVVPLWGWGSDLGGEVDVGSSVQQQLGHAHVLVVSRDVQRREASLQTQSKAQMISVNPLSPKGPNQMRGRRRVD